MNDVFSAHRHDGGTRLDPARTALVVVDMINEFCKPGGRMVLPGYERLVPPQRSLLDAARERGIPIIWVVDSHRRNMRRDREWLKRTPHCVEHTWATEVIEELEPREDDLRVIKHRYSGFFQTDLDLLLRDMLIEQLVVCGVVTNICVRSTVHDGFFLGYDIVVPHDACAATGPREQLSSLYDIATHFGTVSDTASVVRALDGGEAIGNRVFDDESVAGADVDVDVDAGAGADVSAGADVDVGADAGADAGAGADVGGHAGADEGTRVLAGAAPSGGR